MIRAEKTATATAPKFGMSLGPVVKAEREAITKLGRESVTQAYIKAGVDLTRAFHMKAVQAKAAVLTALGFGGDTTAHLSSGRTGFTLPISKTDLQNAELSVPPQKNLMTITPTAPATAVATPKAAAAHTPEPSTEALIAFAELLNPHILQNVGGGQAEHRAHIKKMVALERLEVPGLSLDGVYLNPDRRPEMKSYQRLEANKIASEFFAVLNGSNPERSNYGSSSPTRAAQRLIEKQTKKTATLGAKYDHTKTAAL